MSKKNRPPFEGLYIYAFLTLIAFVLSDLLILKTQLFLESRTPSKAAPPSFRPPLFANGLIVRNAISSDKYETITERNLFNSDGLIPPPFGADGESAVEDDSMPIKSDLPIQVLGTLVHANPYRSIASLSLQGEEMPATLKVGGLLKDLAEIVAVFRRRVIFKNLSKNDRLEYVEIPEEPEVQKRKQLSVLAPKFQRPQLGNEPLIKTEGNNFTVSRSDVKSQLNNYQSLLSTARAIPYTDPATGEVVGFKVTQLQPGSLFQKLGIRPGDVIKGVNGEPVNSINKALEVFANLKGSVDDIESVNISVDRGGSEQALNYNMTE